MPLKKQPPMEATRQLLSTVIVNALLINSIQMFARMSSQQERLLAFTGLPT